MPWTGFVDQVESTGSGNTIPSPLFFHEVSSKKDLAREIFNIKKRVKQATTMGLKVHIDADNSDGKIPVICAGKVWVYNGYFGT
jgi:gamma-glutamyl:cysteine ligase YbdK (ATP-grasp superfamily)